MLMELVGALSRASDPKSVLLTFAAGYNRIYGPRGYVSLSTRGLGPGEYRITRLMADVDPEEFAAVDTWSNPAASPVRRGGLLGEIIRSAWPEVIHHLDVPDDPVVGDFFAPFGSLMAIPLFADGEPLNWAITLRKSPEGFSVEELEEAILRSNLVGGTVRSTLMARQLREAHRSIEREIEKIAEIQRSLLPSAMPEIAGLSLAASYETFGSAGGDYYDFLPLGARDDEGRADPRGPWAIIVADASGHGPSAAVVMAMLHALLHALPRHPEGPAEMLDFVNEHLHAKRIDNSFVTALVAFYDPVPRRLVYARAGHNPPVLMRRGSGGWVMDRLEEVGGVPLAVLPDVRYEEATIQLEPGQTLVLYTDGVSEARSPEGVMFGVAGIEHSLTECTGAPECVIDHVTTALKIHEATVRPRDDQTLVVVRVDGE
jgi:sigma-B regulation protein RsbU (phosphoserine phosphatase)